MVINRIYFPTFHRLKSVYGAIINYVNLIQCFDLNITNDHYVDVTNSLITFDDN